VEYPNDAPIVFYAIRRITALSLGGENGKFRENASCLAVHGQLLFVAACEQENTPDTVPSEDGTVSGSQSEAISPSVSHRPILRCY
jgi:hypothetical protein